MPEDQPPWDVLAGTNLFARNPDYELGDIERAHRALLRLNRGESRENVHQKLQQYKKYSTLLLNAYVSLAQLTQAYEREIELLQGSRGIRHGKRWTDEEDEVLVEQACDPESTMMTLALLFNRTPGAISSRLSYLVGVKRISHVIVGRLTGYVNGDPVEGALFEGTVTKLDGTG